MKKNYINFLSIAFALLIATAAFAQNRIAKMNNVTSLKNIHSTVSSAGRGISDTLTNHWDVIAPVAVDTPILYSAKSGFVAGQNNFKDKAKVQKFDSNFGVTSGGTITSLLLWFGAKRVGAGTAAFTATIWSDNAGMPGNVLGTAPAFAIATIDTNLAALHTIGPLSAVKGAYNVAASFSSPVSIPSNQIFWAGISFTYASGDSAGLITSSDPIPGDGIGVTGDFPFASTHVFEQLSDNSWQTFNDGMTTADNTWASDVALAVYPVVNLSVGVNEKNSNLFSLVNMPNPAKDITTIKYEMKEPSSVELSVTDITGKEMLVLNQGIQNAGAHSVRVDVSEFPGGMYFYSLKSQGYSTTRKMTVVR